MRSEMPRVDVVLLGKCWNVSLYYRFSMPIQGVSEIEAIMKYYLERSL